MDKQINYIVFEGRRWFDKVNGNTYHSRKVTVTFSDGTNKVLTNNFDYGYGSQWYHELINDLVKDGLFESTHQAQEWIRNNYNKTYETCNDVTRKKDLKFL